MQQDSREKIVREVWMRMIFLSSLGYLSQLLLNTVMVAWIVPVMIGLWALSSHRHQVYAALLEASPMRIVCVTAGLLILAGTQLMSVTLFSWTAVISQLIDVYAHMSMVAWYARLMYQTLRHNQNVEAVLGFDAVIPLSFGSLDGVCSRMSRNTQDQCPEALHSTDLVQADANAASAEVQVDVNAASAGGPANAAEDAVDFHSDELRQGSIPVF